MTDTRDKLNEARYFLQRMRDCCPERDAFRYNLTAFLSAARSITQIMQKEFAGVSGFQEWYSQKQTEMKNHPVMKYLHEQRKLSYHVKPIRPHAHISLDLVDHVTVTDSVQVVLSGTGNEVRTAGIRPEPETAPASSATIEVKYYFEDFLGRDVISICEEDLMELEKLAVDCEKGSWQSPPRSR